MEGFGEAITQVSSLLAERRLDDAVAFLIASSPFTGHHGTPAGDAALQRTVYLARRNSNLQPFLDALLLQRDVDDVDYHPEKLSLLTLHAAKGLEFDVVFIIGCEETLLPMSLPGLTSDPEEERRLFYVGMTRARNQLHLVRTQRRVLFGKPVENAPSRFLADIEEQLKEYEAWQVPTRKTNGSTEDNQLSLF